MDRFPLKPLAWLSWQALDAWRRWGAASILGTACLAAAATLAWQAELCQRETSAETQAMAALQTRSTPVTPEQPDAAVHRLRAFSAALPLRAVALGEVGHLFDIAKASGVQLEQGEYRWVGDANSGMYRYQMTFPIKAEPLKTQRFVIAALATIPTLALRSIAFHRDNPTSKASEARIDFDLITRAE